MFFILQEYDRYYCADFSQDKGNYCWFNSTLTALESYFNNTGDTESWHIPDKSDPNSCIEYFDKYNYNIIIQTTEKFESLQEFINAHPEIFI